MHVTQPYSVLALRIHYLLPAQWTTVTSHNHHPARYLYDNRIEEIDPAAFASLPSLMHLYLQDNVRGSLGTAICVWGEGHSTVLQLQGYCW